MEVIMGLVNLTIVLFVVGIILYNKYKPTKDDRPEAPPSNTVEDYIKLESTDHLKTIARKLFYISPVDTEYYTVSYRSSGWNDQDLRFTYKAPSNLLEEDSPDAIMLLKILEERGDDPNAGFLLGIIYEFGLINNIDADMEEAKKHYEIAKEQGSKLVGLLDILRRKWLVPDGICEDKNEVIFVNMTPYRLKAIADAELQNYYNDYCRKDEADVKLAATLGLVHYQRKGSPLCSALVGIFSSPDVGVYDAISLENFSSSRDEKMSQALISRVKQAARYGNSYATVVCQTYHFQY